MKITENSYSRFGWDPLDETIKAGFFRPDVLPVAQPTV